MNDILDKSLDSSEDVSDENSQNEEHEVQGERNVEADEDDEIPIANIMKRIIENVTKYQEKTLKKKAKEVVDVDEDTKTSEKPVINAMKGITRSIYYRVKEKKKEKDVPPKFPMKDTVNKKENTPKGKYVTKRRKVESKVVEKKSLNRNLVQSSDSETDVEEHVQYIVATIRRKVGGNRIHVNIPAASMDNVSFHFETNVQKWKYAFQRRIAAKRELGTEALDCKEIMNLLKVVGLMKKIINIVPCYEKLVREFIVNISYGYNVEGSKEYMRCMLEEVV